jgi:hypothetical protein
MLKGCTFAASRPVWRLGERRRGVREVAHSISLGCMEKVGIGAYHKTIPLGTKPEGSCRNGRAVP